MCKDYVLPAWCKEAKKALVDRGMSVKELAEAVGYSREHTSSVLNGNYRSAPLKKVICEFLNVAV